MRITKTALLVFFVLAFTYGYFFQDPSVNGNSRLALTMAIVKEGRLNIDTFVKDEYNWGTIDLANYLGKYYTDKAIGSSVMGAIFYYPIYTILHQNGINLSVPDEKHLLTFFVMGLPSAIAGTLIFLVCLYLSKSRFRAFIVTLAIALGTMSFPFSVIYFGHQLAASFLFSAFFVIFLIKIQPDQGKIKYFYTFLVGLLLGLALLTDLTTAVVVLPLVVYYFYVLWTRKQLKRVIAWVIPALGGLIPISVMVAYNVQVYGTPFATGYQYLVYPLFRQGMSQGFMGIGFPKLHNLFFETLQPNQGIFWQSPVLIMTLVGGFFMLRQKKFWPELAVAAVACGAYLLLNSGYYMWWGGHSFTVRQIDPMMPFLCLPLIFVPKKLFPAVITLTFISIFQMVIVAASAIPIEDDNLVNASLKHFFAYSAIYDACLKTLADGQFTWNIGKNILGLKSWFSLLPLSITILGSTLLVEFFSHQEDSQPARPTGTTRFRIPWKKAGSEMPAKSM